MAKVYVAYKRIEHGNGTVMVINKIFSSEKAYWKYRVMRLKTELASDPVKSAMFKDHTDKAFLNILKIQKQANPDSLPYIFEVEK